MMEPANDSSTEKKIIRSFYFKNIEKIEEPANIASREFGFRSSSSGAMLRHMIFRNIGELRAFILRETPADIYCSPATYRFPQDRPMEAKGWQGCDLIFDIDGQSIDDMTAAKSAVKVLAGALTDLLGMRKNAIAIYYSGNKGFHVYVESDPEYQSLSSAARLELCSLLKEVGHVDDKMLDVQVTTDIHRIFRMPGTLNSKTLLPKTRVALDSVDAFYPPSKKEFP